MHPLRIRISIGRTAAAAAIVLAASSSNSLAAERQARLTIDVRIQGSESAQASGDWSKSTIAQQYRLVTTVKTDGVLSSVNAKDPDYAQKALAKADQTRQRIRSVQERNAAAGVGPRPASGAAAGALMQEMQTAIGKCGNDQACQQRVGMQYATRADFAAAMSAAAQPEFVCKQQSAGDAARERECLKAAGVGSATGSVDPDAPEESEDERYLIYIGWIGCPSQISLKMDDRLQGAYADVAGMIPYTETYKADWNGTPTERSALCVHHDLVLDTKARTIYTNGAAIPEIRGRSVRAERGRAEQSFDGVLPMPPGIAEFLYETLREAPLSGTRRGIVRFDRPYRCPPPITQYSGAATVDVSWKFEPL